MIELPPAEARALELIYDAAVQPAAWPAAIEQVATVLGGEAGALTRMDVSNGRGGAIMLHDDGAGLKAYFDYYYRINPLQLVRDPVAYSRGWVPAVLRDEDWIPREELEATEYYNDYLRPQRAEWGLIVRLGLSGLDVAALNIGRSRTRGRFGVEAIATARRLQPHLIRAFSLGERLATMQSLNDGLAVALDRSSAGMILLDSEGRILHVNALGERLLAEGDALRSTNGRLAAAGEQVASALRVMVRQAAHVGARTRGGGQLLVPRGDTRPPLTVTTMPLRETASPFAGAADVLVCVADPAVPQAPAVDEVATLFGLTPAEARLSNALCRGASLRVIAEEQVISINTVRSQLASIFAKTNTHRQIELISLLTAQAALLPGAGPR